MSSLTSAQSLAMQFLYKRNCFSKTNSSYTHLSMDGHRGGVITISPADEPEFLELYARDVQAGLHLFITEARTPLFRFFVDTDFDFADKAYVISSEGRFIILRLINAVVQLFYPTDTNKNKFRMIILDTATSAVSAPATQSSAVFSDDEEEDAPVAKARVVEPAADLTAAVNNNMHIMFPWLVVNEEQAYAMGQAIACKLTKIIGNDIGLSKNWFNVVDSSVYLSNGLRMIGSRKCIKCPACRGKRCTECLDIGKVDKGRAYRVSAVYQDGRYDTDRYEKLVANYAQAVSYCSIRQLGAQETTAGWQRYVGCPAIDPCMLTRIHNKRASVVADTRAAPARRFNKLVDKEAISTDFAEDTAGQKKQKSLTITYPEHSPFFIAAAAEVRRFSVVYSQVIVRSVMSSESRTYYRVCVHGEGSSICLNLTGAKKEHNNNSVYFLIKPSGVYQRCWCSCDTTQNRKFGLCKKYTSTPIVLLQKHLSTLFPTYKTGGGSTLEPYLRINGSDTDAAETRAMARLYLAAFTDTPPTNQKKTMRKKRKM